MYLVGATCGGAAVLVTYLSSTNGAILAGSIVICMLVAVAWLEKAPYERQTKKIAT
jgi:hypothetical protein